jgi:hypothetical protein
VVNARPSKIEIDGVIVGATLPATGASFVLSLPRGQHFVQLTQ